MSRALVPRLKQLIGPKIHLTTFQYTKQFWRSILILNARFYEGARTFDIGDLKSIKNIRSVSFVLIQLFVKSVRLFAEMS